MNARYVLAPRAIQNLSRIWNYLEQEAGEAVADRVELAIRQKLSYLAKSPGGGHRRSDLTDDDGLRFVAVYSYLIVYRPNTTPLEIINVLHGSRDIRGLLY